MGICVVMKSKSYMDMALYDKVMYCAGIKTRPRERRDRDRKTVTRTAPLLPL